MGIHKKMVKGVGWLFLEKGVQQIASFVVFAVIIRMIGPEEYGLVALCGIIMMLMNTLSFGLSDVVISMRIRDDERLSSLFWMVTGCGAVLSLLSFALAHPFAAIFGQEKLAPLLQVFSILPFLSAITSVPITLITATMDFRILTIRTLIASLIGGAFGIVCAIKGGGAYALAIQQIAAQIVTIIIVFISLSWRPRLMFNFIEARKMLKFGLGQTGSLFTVFVEMQMPRFVLGYFLGPESVGYYAFIQRISGVLQDALIQPILRVMYPAISDMLDNPKEKQRLIKQTIFIIGSVVFPTIAGIILTAPIFIPVLFGTEWTATTNAMQIFIFALAALSFNIMFKGILRAHHYVYVYLRAQIILIIFTSIGYFLSVSSGLTAVVTMFVFSSFIGNITYLILTSRHTKLSIVSNYLSLWSPLSASLIMSGILFTIQRNGAFNTPNISNIIILITLGCVIYTSSLLLFSWKPIMMTLRDYKKRKEQK